MEKLFEWARGHGAVINGCTRLDKGVRGFYTTSQTTTPLLQIPNSILISPHHIAHHPFHSLPYSALFAQSPELFDPAHPTE